MPRAAATRGLSAISVGPSGSRPLTSPAGTSPFRGVSACTSSTPPSASRATTERVTAIAATRGSATSLATSTSSRVLQREVGGLRRCAPDRTAATRCPSRTRAPRRCPPPPRRPRPTPRPRARGPARPGAARRAPRARAPVHADPRGRVGRAAGRGRAARRRRRPPPPARGTPAPSRAPRRRPPPTAPGTPAPARTGPGCPAAAACPPAIPTAAREHRGEDAPRARRRPTGPPPAPPASAPAPAPPPATRGARRGGAAAPARRPAARPPRAPQRRSSGRRRGCARPRRAAGSPSARGRYTRGGRNAASSRGRCRRRGGRVGLGEPVGRVAGCRRAGRTPDGSRRCPGSAGRTRGSPAPPTAGRPMPGIRAIPTTHSRRIGPFGSPTPEPKRAIWSSVRMRTVTAVPMRRSLASASGSLIMISSAASGAGARPATSTGWMRSGGWSRPAPSEMNRNAAPSTRATQP